MIKVQDLVYKYPDQDGSTIKGISFQIEKGEIYGFLGPSGAGKSTTQKLLIRLLSGYGGSAKILGKPLTEWNNTIYNHIGVGFELPNHYPKLSGLENLQMFSSMYDKKPLNLPELMDSVGLLADKDKLTSAYSKGMKMRLNFIRAIMHDPEILFLDEPTSGLDPANAQNIKEIIKKLKQQGKTIFLTTHNMYDADELCDRVAFINQGKIIAEDTPTKLKLCYGKPQLKVCYTNGTKQHFNLDHLGQNIEFIASIKNDTIESMHSTEATLDEVFIKTTGTKLTL